MKKILSLTIAALAACTMLSASGKVHVLTSSSYLDNDKMVFVSRCTHSGASESGL